MKIFNRGHLLKYYVGTEWTFQFTETLSARQPAPTPHTYVLCEYIYVFKYAYIYF